jgi:DNA-binding IclR family transcriptional regulator
VAVKPALPQELAIPVATKKADPHEKRTGVQAVERALQLLVAVASSGRPLTVPELARRCELNRTTTWRLITTLERYGFVERNEGYAYELGTGATLLAPERRNDEALVRRSHAALEKLAHVVGATVNLSVPKNGAAVAISQTAPPESLSVDWVGRVLPPHATSDGKIYLAWLPPDEREAYVSGIVERYTPTTITGRDALLRHLEVVVRDRVAYTFGELDLGINGVSVPLLDPGGSLRAIVSVTGSEHRFPEERLREIVPALTETVADIRYALGQPFRQTHN